VNARSAPAPDAAMVLGIASTAMPFARTPTDEAERWLRVLRLHGEAGVALQALGVSEGPLPTAHERSPRAPTAPPDSEDPDVLAPASAPRSDARDAVVRVTEHAVQIASRRGAPTVGTADVLIAVIHVYGEDFERVLRAHGTDSREVLDRLAAQPPGSPDHA
jgi:hypothetical protein